jgi:hypothetical protein
MRAPEMRNGEKPAPHAPCNGRGPAAADKEIVPEKKKPPERRLCTEREPVFLSKFSEALNAGFVQKKTW